MPENLARGLEWAAGIAATAIILVSGWFVRRVLTNEREIEVLRAEMRGLKDSFNADAEHRERQRDEDRDYWKSMAADIRALRDRQ